MVYHSAALGGALMLGAFSGAWPDETIIEAEDFACAEESLLPVTVGVRDSASGGTLVAVRARETGAPNWVDFYVTAEGGLYELAIRAGGNNSRQAGLVSIDAGEPVTVLDEPQHPLPLGAQLPPDHEERSKLLEETFREHVVGSARLTAGEHRIRVQHAGLPDRSNSFGLDWVKLSLVAASDAPPIDVGQHVHAEDCTLPTAHRSVELHVLTSYRFFGPDERPTFAVFACNHRQEGAAEGRYAVELVEAADERPALAIARSKIRLQPGESAIQRYEPDVSRLQRGTYWISARLQLQSGEVLSDRAELVLADLNTPAWTKRARTKWVRYNLGMDLDEALGNLRAATDAGISVVVNANVGDWLGEEAISYPFRGGEGNFRAFLDATHELGACQMMYHTMVTVSEHFYYEHKDFWGGRQPFYHCSWLSIFPDSEDWNRYQAADFEYALQRFPLDGIFLDNACASGAPGMREQSGEESIAHHQEGLRRAIKRANPTGILYPNYNTLSSEGLRTVSRAWDAHMLEGRYPCPAQKAEGNGTPVSAFVQLASRVRNLTGKPFWPLMYAPSGYHRLCIAACSAARANPCGVTDAEYLQFLHDIQEYVYADDVFAAPPGTVTLTASDPNLAATALMKVYRAPSARSAPLRRDTLTRACDWIIQIVNAAEVDGEPVEREVGIRLDVPEEALKRGGYVLRPGAESAERVEITNPLRLRVGTWAVLILTDQLLPKVEVRPRLIDPVPGESFALEINLAGWSGGPVSGRLQLTRPKQWASGRAVTAQSGKVARVTFRPPGDTTPGNHELSLRLTCGERTTEIPLLARVKPRLAVALRPDHFAVMPDGRSLARPTSGGGLAELHLTNHSSRAIRGSSAITAPDGWTAMLKKGDFSLEPGDAVAVPCELRWPEFRPQSLYDLIDADLRVSIETNVSGVVTETIPVRLHVPATWIAYCPLGTRPLDVVKTGATPGGGLLSQIVMTVRGHPTHTDDAGRAIREAILRQKAGEQRVVLWFRTSEEGSDQLGDPEVASGLAEFMRLGGGAILQENVFRASEANRALLDSDVCPISGPYEATDDPGGDWIASVPEHEALRRFCTNVLQGRETWGIPPQSQPARVTFVVKPWARVAANNEAGDPVMVVSTDPDRPVVYLAGSLEGTYLDNRHGVREYPDQMAHLLYFYAELARWLSTFGNVP